jgi:hypothetical protein
MPRMSMAGIRWVAGAWLMLLAGSLPATPARYLDGAADREPAPLHAAAALPVAVFAPLAHSALIMLEAARLPAGLMLQLRRADGAALAVTDLAVSIDGRTVPATVAGPQRWSVPWPQPPTDGAHRLEVQVAHDGIREVLDGTIATAAAAAPAAAGGPLHAHQQLLWWILNITIVFIAAIAISRRMS